MATLKFESNNSSLKPNIRYSSKLLAALNKFAKAISTEVKNPMSEKYGDAYDHLIKGDAHRLRDETEEAIRAYETAIAINPRFTEAYIGMGRCFRRKGDLRRALLALKKALEFNAFDKELHVEIAKSNSEAGMPDKAIHHFRQAVKLDPQYIEAKFNLALCLELQGHLMEPLKLYKDIIAQDKDFIPAYNNLGSIYMRQGDYAASEAMFRTLIDMAPDFSRGYFGLAIALDRSNRPQEALKYYEKLLLMKAQQRNREYIETRIHTLRKSMGKRQPLTSSGQLLIRVK